MTSTWQHADVEQSSARLKGSVLQRCSNKVNVSWAPPRVDYGHCFTARGRARNSTELLLPLAGMLIRCVGVLRQLSSITKIKLNINSRFQ